ncbi:MAG: hypothetical protein ACTTJ2_06955 [Anaerovoracaceae bacterium]
MIDFNLEEQQKLDLTNPAIIKQVDNMYVDFYLEDDMFELEGQFFTVDGELYIEVHDAVMHILEMAGKELKVGTYGNLFTATRPDGHRFMMEINRVYYKLQDPDAADLQKLHDEEGINEFFLKLTDVMTVYQPENKKWQFTKNKINMYYIGDRTEYDTLEDLFKDNPEDIKGLWQAVIYEAYEEESDYTFKF